MLGERVEECALGIGGEHLDQGRYPIARALVNPKVLLAPINNGPPAARGPGRSVIRWMSG
ncbi:MAG: hypothetical protein IT537_05500 [Hyphomicrobiales bacterium]|nr:hypothetical protein [Hyphomicrobiales bacterium]